MKDVKVLGPGCARCEELMAATKKAIDELQLDCSLEKISDIQQIAEFGVMITPALVVDGEVKFSGKVPSNEELKKLLA